MWGNNFGLFGSAAKAKRMLRRLDRLTGDHLARLIEGDGDLYAAVIEKS
jgi:hypothetical protein